MRVVVISDTHNRHDEIDLPEGDILVHCGDATGRGRPQEVMAFLSWFENQHQFEHRVMIAGNHDFMFQEDPYLVQAEIAERSLDYLQDSGISIEGVKFYGSPWQPWFHDWAFNLQRGDEIAEKWAMIPDDTEFLITHGPPKGIFDQTRGLQYAGCFDLLERVKEIKPSVHAFGHIHEGYGYGRASDTLFVNASICTRDYVPSNKPIVLERYDERIWDVIP